MPLARSGVSGSPYDPRSRLALEARSWAPGLSLWLALVTIKGPPTSGRYSSHERRVNLAWLFRFFIMFFWGVLLTSKNYNKYEKVLQKGPTIEPKWLPAGTVFNFCKTLFSCTPTMVWLVFWGPRGSRSAPKSIEKPIWKTSLKKTLIFTKIYIKAPQNGPPKDEYSTRRPPTGLSFRVFFLSFCAFGQKGSPGRAGRVSRASRSTQSTTQWYQNRDRRLLEASQNVVDSCSALIQKWSKNRPRIMTGQCQARWRVCEALG